MGLYRRKQDISLDIVSTSDPNDSAWLALRAEFIPEVPADEQRVFLQAFARQTAAFRAFIAQDPQLGPVGFAEVAVRRDFVNGCEHRPALFLEGIYVQPRCRGRGVARALCEVAGAWGLEQGCREFASDVYIDDHDSLAAHRGLGFEETERVVYFRKLLTRAQP
jgi:aminoglycoside 6'-N-acetyltransferase I